jgi:hypothetical protein
MGCRGCPEKSRNLRVDRHGNPIPEVKENIPQQGSSTMSDYEKEVYNQASNVRKEAMNYRDYIREKKIQRDKTREISDTVVKTFSDDYKRIQIDELISVFNNEEVHRLSPTQSLVMLYELVHHAEYQKIIDEFESLKEQVDIKYKSLMDQKIITTWRPK